MSEENEKELSFLPFHALNQFMRDDFRRDVIRTAVMGMARLPGGFRSGIDRYVRRYVSVPGLRNSVKAPPALKARHLPGPFEDHPDLVASVLAAWAEIKTELRGQVFELLTERGWDLLPVDADRTRLPGFMTVWPAGEDFEVLNEVFAEKFPESEATTDEVSLMVVWMSGRLPVDEPEE